MGAARGGMAGEVAIGIRLAFGPDWLRIVVIHGTDPEGILWGKAVGRPLSGRKDRCKRFEISGSVTAERETTMSGRRTANENEVPMSGRRTAMMTSGRTTAGSWGEER